MTTREEKKALQNRNNQKTWYLRHKNPYGRVYRIYNVVTGEDYIGCTSNDLRKRLAQARAAGKAGKRQDPLSKNIKAWGTDCFEIELLYEGTLEKPGFVEESNYISDRQPKLNLNLFQF